MLLLLTVTSTVVDYQFNAIAGATFQSADALTRFFGTFFALINTLAFVLQLTLGDFILSRLGVGASLALLPLAISTSSVLFFAAPRLGTAALAKSSDDGLSNSLNR